MGPPEYWLISDHDRQVVLVSLLPPELEVTTTCSAVILFNSWFRLNHCINARSAPTLAQIYFKLSSVYRSHERKMENKILSDVILSPT